MRRLPAAAARPSTSEPADRRQPIGATPPLADAPPARLICHASTPCAAVDSIEVWVKREGGQLTLSYEVAGDLSQLQPTPTSPPATDGADALWRHTCLEAFVAAPQTDGYWEFNFAASGAWSGCRFAGYREPASPAVAPATTSAIAVTAVTRTADRLYLQARIALEALEPVYPWTPRTALRLAIAAVIEQRGGGLCYWALRHPPGRPDFHHPDGFTLRI